MILFCGALQRMGYSVKLVCAKAEGRYASLVPSDVELIDLKAPRMLSALTAFRSVLLTECPAVVYSTIVHANLAVLLASIGIKGTKVIIRESNAPISEEKRTIGRKFSHFLAKLLYPRATAIICVSEKVREELLQMCPTAQGRVVVCPTPVIDASLLQQSEEALPDEDRVFFQDTPTIVSVARLHPQKNLSLLLKALATVNQTRPLQLAILGDGALKQTLIAEALQLGIANQVRFFGFKSNPFSYMRAARALVLSSDYEGMPNVIIQALSLEVPVVSTDCPGGSREVLKGGEWGYLSPVGDSNALASSIILALDAPKVVNREEVLGTYGVDGAALGYLKVAAL
jgi:glycosyltransferase involved in cell wall biosynthesis